MNEAPRTHVHAAARGCGPVSRTTIALDVDGVLADFIGPVLEWASRRSGRERTKDEINDYDILKALGMSEHAAELDALTCEQGFCESLPVIPGAHEFVEALRAIPGADVFIVTSPLKISRFWMRERVEWCERHFGFGASDVIFCSKKERILADVLIDDGAHNVEAFAKNGGGAVLIDQPWNRVVAGPNITRARTFNEALAAI